MDAPAWRPSLVSLAEGAVRVAQEAARMADALYAEHVGLPPEREHAARVAAWRVLEAGGSPAAYVRYVVERLRAGKRRVYWSHVLGARALDAWLPEFTKNMREARESASYVAPPARRAEYAERMRHGLLPTP